jgi:hypothetical protein
MLLTAVAYWWLSSHDVIRHPESSLRVFPLDRAPTAGAARMRRSLASCLPGHRGRGGRLPLGGCRPGCEILARVTEEDVNRLRQVYAEWAMGNFAAGRELFAPELVAVWSEDFPTAGTYRGPRAHTAAMREWLSVWENVDLEAESFREVGDSRSYRSRFGLKVKAAA